jgi:hypothetical protein
LENPSDAAQHASVVASFIGGIWNINLITKRDTLMKEHVKCFATALALASGLALAGSAQAQGITGTPYLSNINPADASFTGYWATPLTTVSSTATGMEFVSAGGSGSFSTMYYGIPVANQVPTSPLDAQVTFKFTWNSGNAVGGVNVLFALDDSLGGVNYYGTTYNNLFVPGTQYTYTFPLQAANLANIQAGAVIAGMNFQIDPANVSGNYDITYNSLVVTPIPEPTMAALAGLGLAGLWIVRRRNK